MIRRALASIPIRWRLALVSATLTFLALLGFSIIIGRITADRLQENFDSEISVAAADLQDQLRLRQQPDGSITISGPDLNDYASAQKAVIRILRADGEVLQTTKRNVNLGPPSRQAGNIGDYRVVARPVAAALGEPFAWVQIGVFGGEVDDTVRELWFLLVIGIVAGTGLALVASRAIATRAIRPIAVLTRTAQDIGKTGDTSRRIDVPRTHDEVADLAKTMDEMLVSLNTSKAELEKVLQAQREFIADASHELRTPLTSIVANLDFLQSQLPPQGEESELVDAAKRSSIRMKNLVSDLLILARADIGDVQEPEQFDLERTVTDVVSEVESYVSDHKLEVALPGREISISGKMDDMHRLVLNLVENAVKYTPAGSTVAITLTPNGNYAELQVTDSGEGIPQELRPKIFDRFTRGKGVKGGGTGLGLSIVQAVAEIHGGSVTVGDSALGGALFTVRLPLANR